MISRRASTVSGIIVAVGLILATGCTNDDSDASSAGPTAGPITVDGAAIDVHTHLGSADVAARLGVQGAAAADDLIERMDEAGIERAVVLSLAYMSVLPDDAAVRAENDFAAAEVARYPDRLVFFCGINPARDQALDEIDRCADELGARGIKLHIVGSRLDMTMPGHIAALASVFDRAQARELPVLIHVANPIGLPLDSDALTNFGTIVAQHPDVRIVFAHCFSLLDIQQLELINEGVRQGLLNGDSLFLDISSCLENYEHAPVTERELIVWRLREFGVERIFFGSDYLRFDPTAQAPGDALNVLTHYPFTQAEIDQILENDASAWLTGD